MGMKRPVIHGFQKKSIFWKTFFMISNCNDTDLRNLHQSADGQQSAIAYP